MNKNELNDTERSEEVQEIIDRMPTKGATYVVILTSILILIVLLLGFVIKYPDTIDGQISITAHSAPVRLFANSSGKIHLQTMNQASVKDGQVLACVESGADYKHILLIDSLLKTGNVEDVAELSVPKELMLGEISSAFSSFVVAHSQYRRMLQSDVYRIMCTSLQQQIEIDRKILDNIERERALKDQVIQLESAQLNKDSILATMDAVSKLYYQKQQREYLSLREAYEALNSEKLSRLSQVSKNQQQLQQLMLEEQEGIDKLLIEFLARKNELANSVRLWQEKYLLYSPMEGQVEYLGFWRENSFVQSGQELFSIIPLKNEVVGEVMIPAYGAGKVTVGQIANVKIENYPYDEYGLVKGIVHSISRLSNKVQTSEGSNAHAYRVLVSFPDGLHTNFGKELMPDFESKGVVEIITKRKRLIERLFDNLKAKTEK